MEFALGILVGFFIGLFFKPLSRDLLNLVTKTENNRKLEEQRAEAIRWEIEDLLTKRDTGPVDRDFLIPQDCLEAASFGYLLELKAMLLQCPLREPPDQPEN